MFPLILKIDFDMFYTLVVFVISFPYKSFMSNSANTYQILHVTNISAQSLACLIMNKC